MASQVAAQKKGTMVQVPVIHCPHPGCSQPLKKQDVQTADDGKTSGVQLFQRLRNNLIISTWDLLFSLL